ncbi:MAG TPA: CTP synthase [Cyclobacteriaceae bacterium]
MPAKYIFVTGGVTSSLGKGIISASLGKLLQGRGLRVTIQKFDPYINIDPGTLNPYEHGECFVTDDGAETDLDLGHYERFLNISTSQANNLTTGRIYYNVIKKEREGEFLGKTVQVVPHITDEIKNNIYLLGETGEYDVVITEIGGCIGDIESLPFVEAVRQARLELGMENVVAIHLTLVPYIATAGELKTKPTQHSVKQLLEAGIQPDILVCRSEYHLPKDIRRKIALFCNVPINSVIEAIDAETIYDVPVLMRREKLDERVLQKLNLPFKEEPILEQWKEFLGRLKNPTDDIKIGLVGKYVELKDAYKSIAESFTHAGTYNDCSVDLKLIPAEKVTPEMSDELFGELDGILVAPGFGERGIEGKITAIKYARVNRIPFFGICLGLQCATVEIARNLLHLPEAASTEINPNTPDPVIDLMEEQKKVKNYGGTMRLGSYECKLEKGTLTYQSYKTENIKERHRHRYEFNDEYLEKFKEVGFIASGRNPKTNLVEIMELKDHPWFIGSQFHPELKSTVLNPHPLFISFVKAALVHKKEIVTA